MVGSYGKNVRWQEHMFSTKKLYSNKPEGLRLVGRPRKHWLNKV
jgi:hypothetical protein